jgi:hypothetical protein
MNSTATSPERGPINRVVSSLAEAEEPIPLTIPLDRPEPAQPQLSPGKPDPEPQSLGDLARDDDDDWK